VAVLEQVDRDAGRERRDPRQRREEKEDDRGQRSVEVTRLQMLPRDRALLQYSSSRASTRSRRVDVATIFAGKRRI
jgi:hypothetical protein